MPKAPSTRPKLANLSKLHETNSLSQQLKPVGSDLPGLLRARNTRYPRYPRYPRYHYGRHSP